jgi:uncharacterized protein involved in exopolysaccharide biosynthesis
MEDTIIVAVIVAASGALLLAWAGRISAALVRRSARRLPIALALRMEEEWLGELNEIPSRPSKLAFAVALTLTPRRSFVGAEEESMKEVRDRPGINFAILRDWKSLLIIPTLCFAAAGYGASYFFPVQYASQARLIAVSQNLPTEFVHDQTGDHIEEEVQISKARLLTRDSLVKLLNQFDMRKEGEPMDRTVEALSRRITVQYSPLFGNPKLGSSIEVKYVDSDPVVTQRFTRTLTELLLSAFRQSREENLMGTQEFLQTQLGSLHSRLIETLRNSPGRKMGPAEKRMQDLNYELLQSSYKSLFTKVEELKILINLQIQQRGSQLVLVETPTLGVPVGPNRLAIASIGAMSGLALGGMAIAGIHRKPRRALA